MCVCCRLGAAGLDYRQQSQQMELRTGGMSVSPQVVSDSAHLDMYEQVKHSLSHTHSPHILHTWTCVNN